jgi:hypothetical protein
MNKISRNPLLIFTLFVLFFCGCATVPDVMNDNRTITQLVKHLNDCGLKVEKSFPVRYQAILANDGIVMVIEGVRVEFYEYDVHKPYQKEKLEKIKKNKHIMILGTPVPAITNGKFIMLTYSDKPELIKIIRAFRSFKMNEAPVKNIESKKVKSS